MQPMPVAALVAIALTAAAAEAGAAAPYDFNDDGYQELVAGAPYRADSSAPAAGAVLVVPGASGGLAPAPVQLITQSTEGVPDVSEGADHFGQAVASADFDGDGHADLAIGSEEPSADPSAFGAVTVLYGTATGLTGLRSTRLTDGGGLRPPGSADADETFFAEALVAGDVDRDGFADLVVGTSGVADRRDRAAILYGSPTGLTPDRTRWLVSPNRVLGELGSVLALGDVNGDGHLDLVEAAPGSANASSYTGGGENGYLTYCAGARAGPTRCDRLVTWPDSVGAPRRGPASLAIGDVTGDGFPDIVAGVPDDRRYSEFNARGAGAVVIVRGNRRGPARNAWVIGQETRGVPGRSRPGDKFGSAVAVARLQGDRYADIVVGASGEDRVTVLRGGRSGVRARGASWFGRKRVPAAGKGFGGALSLLDHNGDGRLDVTVGSRGVNAGDRQSGTTVTLLGRRGRFRMTGTRVGAEHLGVGPRAATGLGRILGG